MAIVDEVEAVADISDSSEDSDILDAELVSEDEIGFNWILMKENEVCEPIDPKNIISGGRRRRQMEH